MNCLICGHENLENVIISDYFCVTSDLRPTSNQNEKWQCQYCGLIQTNISLEWKRNVKQIYSGYSAFEISGHSEQKTFQNTNQFARSKFVVDSVVNEVGLGKNWLDFGCGDGSTICQVSYADANAKLFVYDLDKNKENLIRDKCDLTYFFDETEFESLPKFDAIVMSHVLEHLENPLEVLTNLRDKIEDDGILAIQVPNIEKNNLDLGVYDHVSHFCIETLKSISIESGWRILRIDRISIPKEIIMILQKNLAYNKNSKNNLVNNSSLDLELINKNLNVKKNKITTFADDNKLFAIFGTSIAAIWLSNNCEMKNEMWLDEDISRVGRNWLGKPILDPRSLSRISNIILPFSHNLSIHKINTLIENEFMNITII